MRNCRPEAVPNGKNRHSRPAVFQDHRGRHPTQALVGKRPQRGLKGNVKDEWW